MTKQGLSEGSLPPSDCARADFAAGDGAPGVIFTIHVRERAVPCTLSRRVLELGGSRVSGLTRIESQRATMAGFDLQQNGGRLRADG